MHGIRNISFALCMVLTGPVLPRPAYSQNRAPQGQIFTSASGLSQSVVTAVLQDSLGFLWVGTREGLNKYDGYTFQQYRYQPDTISLSSNSIRCLAEGRQSVLWIGTDNGLNKLDRIRGYLWTHYLPDKIDPGSGNVIYSLFVDREDMVWMRTGNQLIKFDPASEDYNFYKIYSNKSNLLKSDETYSMIMDTEGSVWCGTKDGLQRLEPGSEELKVYSAAMGSGFRTDNIRSVYQDSLGRIWAGAEKGLYLYDPENDTFTDAPLPGAGKMNVHTISPGREDLLIGTGSSLVLYDPVKDETGICEGFLRSEIDTKFSAINSIYEDASEILWIGTITGLVKIDRKPSKFETLNIENASCILHDLGGDLWVGTRDAGLYYFRGGSGTPLTYSTDERVSNRRINNDVIYSVMRDSKGSLWIGTANGVRVMQPGSKSFRPFCSGKAKIICDLFDHENVYKIFEDSKGYIWFGASNGVHRYDPVDRTIESFPRIHHESETLELEDVYCLTEDRNGIFWIGSSVGLIKYIPGEERFEIFQAGRMNLAAGINSNTVFSMHVGQRGDLWVGTASGLNRYNSKTNSFEFINDPVELSEMRIYGILEDGEHNLWLSSERGLVKYHPDLQTFVKYDMADGLQGKEYLPGSSYMDRNGRMYFGGVYGLNTFNPDSIPYNPYQPMLSFTQFVRFREEGGMSKPLPLDRVSSLIVPRGVEIVTIQFSALEFTDPGRNRYLHQMVRKGQDGLWIHNGEQHYVTFYKLSPGKYTLSVKGSNNDLTFSDQEIGLEIQIPYPFWNKTIAIIIYVLAGAFIVFIIIQFRTRHLRRSNRVLREKEISSKEIDRQRHELARKNKSITDSIIYAKRIQQALLPADESFKTLLPDSFVLFKPKDIVSGDFYWINQHGDKIYVAAVDCTGHGVPGAFVSIIGFELFRKITDREQGSNPAMILDTLNENFTEIFSDGEHVYLNDGMDLSLCVIDKKEHSLDFSGAFNPLYLVRNETIIEVKADRFSVGADVHTSNERKLFKSHKIFLQQDDIFYLFSDGYADQFGGPEGKKFKYRRFRHLLLTIHKLPLDKQLSILEASIEEWKGNIDQVDDILVIGIRP